MLNLKLIKMKKDDLLIDSVIGFTLKGITTEITEADGSVRKYTGGIRSTYVHINDLIDSGEPERILPKECNPKWFTNFNQALLDKIRDYHNTNN
jgi:hypothetical protein